MKLLITGGCGFLGSNLAAAALDRGDELLLFDNLHRSGSLENLDWLQNQGNFTFEHGDIRNANDISQVIKSFRPDLIFHLAGQVAMTTSIANPRMERARVDIVRVFNLSYFLSYDHAVFRTRRDCTHWCDGGTFHRHVVSIVLTIVELKLRKLEHLRNHPP